jgi:hypothetical protein
LLFNAPQFTSPFKAPRREHFLYYFQNAGQISVQRRDDLCTFANGGGGRGASKTRHLPQRAPIAVHLMSCRNGRWDVLTLERACTVSFGVRSRGF